MTTKTTHTPGPWAATSDSERTGHAAVGFLKSLAARDAAAKKVKMAHPEPCVVRHQGNRLYLTCLGELATSFWSDGAVRHDHWTAISMDPRLPTAEDAVAVANAKEMLDVARAVFERTLKAAYKRGKPVPLEFGLAITKEREGA